MPSILSKDFVYVPASRTNIRETFRRHGWVGPEEQRATGTWIAPGIVVQELPSSSRIEVAPPPPPTFHSPLQNIGWGGGVVFG